MNNIKMTDLISKLDEKYIEDLCWDDMHTVDVTASEIIDRVKSNINSEKRRTKINFKVAVAICCIIVMSVPCYAFISNQLKQSAILDDSNRHLVGEEVQSDYYIIYDGKGNYTDSYGNSAGTLDELINDEPAASRLVDEIEDDIMEPSSFIEIQPEKVRNKDTIYPELIMVNNSVCILTKSDKTGWELKKGDNLIYEFEKVDSEIADTQTLLIGVIQNGVLKEASVFRAKNGNFSFTAQKDGEYFVYLMSASSDYLTIRESIVKTNK